MKHPILEVFGLAARSIQAWQRLGIDVETEAFRVAQEAFGRGDFIRHDAFMSAWGM